MVKKDNVNEKAKEFAGFLNEAGLIWGPSPEIYGGLAGFFDYGPLGKLLKNRVEESVRKTFNEQGLREVEGPTVLPDVVWKASGHLETFMDRVINCTKCKGSFRLDKIVEEVTKESSESLSNAELLGIIEKQKIVCPNCQGVLGTVIKNQSLMLKTIVGDREASLRPETATVTYLPFLRYLKYFRQKLPFGVFQIGKAYRNEISPRQSVMRGREFTQAEGQIFLDPETKNSWEKYDSIKKMVLPFWDYDSQEHKKGVHNISVEEALKKGFIKSQAYGWCIWLAYTQFKNFGIPLERIRLRQHHPKEKAFYADDAWDIELNLNSFGWFEVCGVHDRTDYDLKKHSEFSGQELVAQRDDGQKFVPHVLEIAFGTDRPVYSLIDLFYEKKEEQEGKTTFRIPFNIAPIPLAIFPLLKKPELIQKAKLIKEELEKEFIIEYDESGSIGKRYLRSSLKGIPLAITIDFESLEKDDVTIRNRDTEQQIRILTKDIKKYVYEKLK